MHNCEEHREQILALTTVTGVELEVWRCKMCGKYHVEVHHDAEHPDTEEKE